MITRMTRTIYTASTLILLMLLPVLSGCATCQTYPGPERSLDKVGILSVRKMHSLRIDEQPITQGNVRRISLLPGPHTIEWEYTFSNLYREKMKLNFQAERGHRYQLVERFIPAAPYGHPFEAVFDFTIDAVVAPLIWLFPPESPAEAPEGVYFKWIVDLETRNVLAGESPDDLTRQASITDNTMDVR